MTKKKIRSGGGGAGGGTRRREEREMRIVRLFCLLVLVGKILYLIMRIIRAAEVDHLPRCGT